jgi:hypothetical protein
MGPRARWKRRPSVDGVFAALVFHARVRKPKHRLCVSRKHCTVNGHQVRPRRKDLASQDTLKMLSFKGCICPNNRRNNSNLKIVLFSVLSSF